MSLIVCLSLSNASFFPSLRFSLPSFFLHHSALLCSTSSTPPLPSIIYSMAFLIFSKPILRTCQWLIHSHERGEREGVSYCYWVFTQVVWRGTHKEDKWKGGRWHKKGVGDEENRKKKAIVIKDRRKMCGLSCCSSAVASVSFSKVASNLDIECSYLVTTRWS